MAGHACCCSKGCCSSTEGRSPASPTASDRTLHSTTPSYPSSLSSTITTGLSISATENRVSQGLVDGFKEDLLVHTVTMCYGYPPESSDESDIDKRGNHGSRTHMKRLKVADDVSRLSDGTADGRSVRLERVILTIKGLKCACCENGISRALDQLPAVQSHQVNIVLARVEFDLDVTRSSVRKVKRKLTRATGYTFEEYFHPEGQVLELVVDDPVEIYRAGRPYGVSLVDSADKSSWKPTRIFSGRNSSASVESRMASPNRTGISSNETVVFPDGSTRATILHQRQTVRVHYDAKKIGAREVLRYYEQLAADQDIQLAPPMTHPSLAAGAKQTTRACLVFVLAAIFTIPVVVFAWGPVDHSKLIYAHISLAFATIVQALTTWEFCPGACRTLVHSRAFDMDSLIAISTTVAYIFSVISYVRQVQGKPMETGSFFETSTLLVTLILLGHVVNEFARLRAAKSVSFRSLQVEEALLVIPGSTPSDRDTRKIDARLLQYGDQFKVLPETRIVTDGSVVQGGSEVDESMITGEPLPVAKGQTSPVHAGTNNRSGTLIVALTALPHENSVSKIATMVENAELTKPKIQALADRIAAWFVPAIVVTALSVFVIRLIVDKYHNKHSSGQAAVKAFTYAIATFVVSCPCAIGLAVPMVILIASGVAARFGIIFRDPQKLEIARNVTDVVFDKTGTLTTNDLSVVRTEYSNGPSTEVRRILLGLLNGLNHPVSAAVFKWVREQSREQNEGGLRPLAISDIQSLPGAGVQGTVGDSGRVVRAGNADWLALAVPEDNCSLLCVTIDGVHRATFHLKTHIRKAAIATVKRLHKRHIRVHMLTGDHAGAATAIAQALELPASRVQSRLKPEDKKNYVEAQQAIGNVVMFVGDGTNDAVALKQAAVGVHLNRGSDVAKSAADVVLMNPRLLDVLVLLDISRAVYRRIILNFAWSFLYNVSAVLLAAGAIERFRIEPQYAGLGELVSVLPVVLIAFQMKFRAYGLAYKREEQRMGEYSKE